MDDGPRAAGVEKRHVDDGRVVVARILPDENTHPQLRYPIELNVQQY